MRGADHVIGGKGTAGAVLGLQLLPASRAGSDPPPPLQVHKELKSLHAAHSSRPYMGVDFTVEELAPDLEDLRVKQSEDDVEIVEGGDNQDAFVAYYADEGRGGVGAPSFHPQLGLAVEALREGFTLDQLWKV